MLHGESGFSGFPVHIGRGRITGGTGQGGAPPPNPTITHTPGLLLGPGQATPKCVAVDSFSIFPFVLYGDAFLVFYTIRTGKVLEILMSFV